VKPEERDVPLSENGNVAQPASRRARLSPLTDDELQPGQRQILSRGLNGDNPRKSTLLRTIVRHPALYTAWQPLGNALLRKGVLSPRMRELAILRTAWLCQCDFEWGQHVPIGLVEGLSSAELAGVIEGPGYRGWTASERAVLAAADDLLADNMIQEETWAELAVHFSDKELIELVFLVGHYTMVAWVMRSLAVPLEDGAHGLDAHEYDYDVDSLRTVMGRWFGSRDKSA
jgi:alkylhydroperoxidase family enzyme